jgi:hypothetical protein
MEKSQPKVKVYLNLGKKFLTQIIKVCFSPVDILNKSTDSLVIFGVSQVCQSISPPLVWPAQPG